MLLARIKKYDLCIQVVLYKSLDLQVKNRIGTQVPFDKLSGMFASADWFFYLMCFTTCLEISWNAYSGQTGTVNVGVFLAILVFSFIAYMFVVSRAAPYFLSENLAKEKINTKSSFFIGVKISLPLGENTFDLGLPSEFGGYLGILSILAYFQLQGQYLMLGVTQSLLMSILLFTDNLVNNLYACIIPSRTTGRIGVFCNLYLQRTTTSIVLCIHFALVLFTFLGSLSVFYPHRGSATVGLELLGWAFDVISDNPTVIRWPVVVITFASLLTNNIARLIGDANLWREIIKRNDGFDISFMLPLYAVSNFIPAILLGIQFNFIPTNVLSYFITFVLVIITFYLAKFLANKVFKNSQLLAVLFSGTLAFVVLISIPQLITDRYNIIATLAFVGLTSIIEIAVHDMTDDSMEMLNALNTEPPVIDKSGTNNF